MTEKKNQQKENKEKIHMHTEWNDITALQEDLGILSSNLTAVFTNAKYDIADDMARQGVLDNRERIDALQLSTGEISAEVSRLTSIVQGGVNYRGKTGVALEDGDKDLTVKMADGTTITVIAGKGGDMVIVPGDLLSGANAEFIWDGEKWSEFGTEALLKSLAYKDTASADYTPAGTISVGDAGAQTATITASFEATNGITSYVTNYTPGKYTPEGGVTIGEYDPEGTVTVSDIEIGEKTTTATVVTAAAFEGAQVTVMTGYTPADYTPSGSVTVNDIAVGQKTFVDNQITDITASGTETTVMTGYTPTAFTPSGDVTVQDVTIPDKSVTFKEVSSATFTGASYTPSANVTPASGTKTFTGSLTQLPQLTADEVVKNVTSATTNVLANASVVNNVLQFGSAPVLSSVEATKAAAQVSYASDLTNITGINIETSGEVISSVGVTIDAFAPSGTIALGKEDVTKNITFSAIPLTATFTGEEITPTGNVLTGNYTPGITVTPLKGDKTLTVDIGTITGVTASFTGTKATLTGEVLTGNYTPSGTIGLSTDTATLTVDIGTIESSAITATFDGTPATLTATFSGTEATLTGTVTTADYTPTGNVSGTVSISEHSHEATFTGTKDTITVS